MRRLRSWRVGGDAANDEGIAMVMVIGVTMVLTLLAVAGVGYAVGTTRKARNDQDWNGALAAAYAGVEEYMSRLANDPSYLSFGNPASPYSSASGANVVLPESTGGSPNPAFSLTQWAAVPGSGGTSHFRYEVDNSTYFTDGMLRLRSTGRVGDEVRSVVADLRQKGFIDFLYFTDFETQDPEISRQTDDTTAMCSRYEYHGRDSKCTIIQFGAFDEIDGPLHTNDTMYVCGGRFLGHTTSSYQPSHGLRYKKPSGCGSTALFKENGSQPAWAELLPMPDTNTELRKETRSDLPTEVPNPGCLFTGPTSIELDASGKMRVRSPWTRKTSPNGANNPGCGTPGTSGLGRSTGQLIDVPLNTVVFVQNVPNVSSDPNYWSPSSSPATCASGGNSLGYPAAGEAVRYPDAYGCRNGDVFIKGVLDGHVTIAAENYIYVTDDITYENPNEDILGLVGQNAVWVMNPVKESNVVNNVSSGSVNSYLNAGYDCVQTSSFPTRYRCTSHAALGGFGYHRRIDAAILSVAHTFMVQNYDKGGARGTLTVNGAIAQKFRGTVATANSSGSIASGYAKDYNYDQRLRTTAPPKFLSPAVITYGVTEWSEVGKAFHADGSPT